MFPCLPYLAYITLGLNPASWAASVAQLAEHWTSNPVVTGSNSIRGSSVSFFTVCLRTMPYLVLPSLAYTCTRFDHVHCTCICMCSLWTYISYLHWSVRGGCALFGDEDTWQGEVDALWRLILAEGHAIEVAEEVVEVLRSLLVAEPVLLVAGEHGMVVEVGEMLEGVGERERERGGGGGGGGIEGERERERYREGGIEGERERQRQRQRQRHR